MQDLEEIKMKKTPRSIIRTIICYLGMCLTFSYADAAEISVFVEHDLARYVADVTVKNQHGTDVFHSESTYFDVDDQPRAFVFTYELSTKNKTETSSLDTAITWDQFTAEKDKLRVLRQSEAEEEKIIESRRKLYKMQREIRRSDEYVTLVISARFDDGPVLDRYFGLPRHEYKRELYRARAKDQGIDVSGERKIIYENKNELFVKYAKRPSANAANRGITTEEAMVSIGDGRKELTSTVKKRMERRKTEINSVGIKKNAQSHSQIASPTLNTIDEAALPRMWKLYRDLFARRIK